MDKSTPIEIEKKYVILMPDAEKMTKYESYGKSEIRQTYLSSDENVTRRVRHRIYSDRDEYTLTEKRRIDKMSSYEDEREITEDAYRLLLSEMREGTHTVKKIRHTFVYLGKLIEIDVYPEWEHTAIMETELEKREERIALPDFIRVIADVTGVKKYSNASMSCEFPKELI